MRFGSTFSGIGGLDLGLERGGWECCFQVENAIAPRKVLQHRWNVPLHDDIRDVDPSDLESVEALVGGFPCRNVSKANTIRQGLSGDQSGLFFHFMRLAEILRPTWVLLENVPGLLTSSAGKDFGTILQVLGNCGYGVGWRVLDSQFFGVPQRRRRVFIVGHVGDWRPSAQVLFEPRPVGQDFSEGSPQQSSSTPRIRGRTMWRKSRRAQHHQDHETWVKDHLANTLNRFDASKPRQTHLVQESDGLRVLSALEWERTSGFPSGWASDILADTVAKQCIGDAVTPAVAEWLARRIGGKRGPSVERSVR